MSGTYSVAALLGCLGVHALPTLPPIYWCLLAPVLVYAAWKNPHMRAASLFGLAACWTLWRAHDAATFVTGDLEGVNVKLIGEVQGLPYNESAYARFDFKVAKASVAGQSVDFSGLVRLSWYQPLFSIDPGQTLDVEVRLARPHAQLNPGSFDVERAAAVRRIRAYGKVDGATVLASSGHVSVHYLREQISKRIEHVVPGSEASLLQGLVVADRRGVSEEQWALLRATGTAHLLAVSGLHIGLVAAAGWWVGCAVWIVFASSCSRLVRSQYGCAASVLFAVTYAALAGFALPTQRALTMLVVFYLAMMMRRLVDPAAALRTALLALLAIDPIAPLGPSFWMSFGAAWALFNAFHGRLRTPSWGRSWLLAQGSLVVLASAMALLFFDQVPLVSPLANLIAVPWVSLFVLPCALIGALLEVTLGQGKLLLMVSALGIDWLLKAASWLVQHLPAVTHTVPEASWWQLAFALAGISLLVQAHPPAPRLLAILFLLPLLGRSPASLSRGEFDVYLLDVGQGLCVVIRTAEQVIVYDTGRAFRSGGNSGERVLVPFLRSQHIQVVDLLVLSHADADHAGGLTALLGVFPVTNILTSAVSHVRDAIKSLDDLPMVEINSAPQVITCHRGSVWEGSGVFLQLWHPYPGLPYMGNDSSCVLRIASANGSILLPGDITKRAELGLVHDAIASDVIVAPHHGSTTSSSQAFIEVVSPNWVLFAAGYQNPFQFPREAVAQRYIMNGSRLLSSYDSGMITLQYRNGSGLTLSRYRETHPRWWRKTPTERMN